MERRIIRKRWQITIPRGVRRRLNLFIGQTVNFDVDMETTTIHMFTGSFATPDDDAAFQEAFYERDQRLGHRKKERGEGSKFRKSHSKKGSKKEALIEARYDKLKKMASFYPTDPAIIEALERARAAEEGREELKRVVSNMSQFLLGLQERI